MTPIQKPLIFGNSGSGKTTLATQLRAEHGLLMLDLDNITWVTDQPGIRLELAQSILMLDQFMTQNSQWVIEGCYGSLIKRAGEHCSELIFLDPGVDKCLSNTLSRPWEPHKYPSPEAQDKNLEFLQDWVKAYYSRTDEYSHQYHLEIYNAHSGKKRKITG